MAARPISFLTDYGLADEFVGVCHGVIARIAPDARVIDLSHGIERHDVRRGALVLRTALPYVPPGVHLAIVDPGVGRARAAVALRCAEEDRILVGPDNGLLTLAAERFGGVVEAIEIGRSPHRLEPVSATFHGRDVFAPVAAQLAAGAPFADAGEPFDPAALIRLDLPEPRVTDEALVMHALAIDRFGNVILDLPHAALTEAGLKLGQRLTLEAGGARVHAWYAITFGDVPRDALLLYEDATWTLALAVNRGSAAETLGIALDDEIHVLRR